MHFQNDSEVVIIVEDDEAKLAGDEIGNLFQHTSSKDELRNT